MPSSAGPSIMRVRNRFETSKDGSVEFLLKLLRKKYKVSDAHIMFYDDWESWIASKEEGNKSHSFEESRVAALKKIEESKDSTEKVTIVLLDAFKDPRARMVLGEDLQCFHASTITKIRFCAQAKLVVDNKTVGKLLIFDAQPRTEFSTQEEALLESFAATLAGLVNDQWEQDKVSQFSGVHLHQHILEILQSLTLSMTQDQELLALTWDLVKQQKTKVIHVESNKTSSLSPLQDLKKKLHFFQRKLILFNHIYGLAMGLEGINVGASENETQLQILEETGNTEDIFTYSLNKHHWQQSLAQLLTEHYAEHSISTHFEHRFDAGRYLIASDPDLLQFCVAVLVGHVYANVEKVHNINVVTSMTKPMTGLRHFCIQITCGLRMMMPQEDLQAALDTIVQQYFCGRCRIVTEHCFQILVPFLVDNRRTSIFSDVQHLADRAAENTINNKDSIPKLDEKEHSYAKNPIDLSTLANNDGQNNTLFVYLDNSQKLYKDTSVSNETQLSSSSATVNADTSEMILQEQALEKERQVHLQELEKTFQSATTTPVSVTGTPAVIIIDENKVTDHNKEEEEEVKLKEEEKINKNNDIHKPKNRRVTTINNNINNNDNQKQSNKTDKEKSPKFHNPKNSIKDVSDSHQDNSHHNPSSKKAPHPPKTPPPSNGSMLPSIRRLQSTS